ncbi:type II secretion system protein [Candidatus Berkelbacteria bacterium]|nr:type II secretion system protein [Candidatus Berkelbacteria bacterium]
MFKRAFTLIELLVVIAIIGILATTVIVNVANARRRARDTRRRADLKSLQTALEAYAQDNPNYPSTASAPNCSGGTPIGGPPVSGYLWCYEKTAGYDPANGYVPFGSAQFLSTLPSDPTTGKNGTNIDTYCTPTGAQAGYWYASDGKDYKIVAACTLESVPAASDPLNDPARNDSGGIGKAFAVYSGGARNW